MDTMNKEVDLSKLDLKMEDGIEHEICGNCKKEIPHFNYVMHTAHCARNITLCSICKEPIPKNQFEEHQKSHKSTVTASSSLRSYGLASRSFNSQEVNFKNQQSTFKNQESNFNSYKPPSNVRKIEEKVDFPRQISKTEVKNLGATPKKLEGFNLKEPAGKLKERRDQNDKKSSKEANVDYVPQKTSDGLLPCRYCDLELVKLDLEEHENYCGSRTDKCNVCGELVMFKYKKLHEESNHGFLKLKDEPGPTPSWDSNTQRTSESVRPRREQPPPIYTVNSFDFSPLYRSYSNDYSLPSDEKRESYKDISRRLDCKTEYIRNLLHDTASITVPLRRSGTAPRNHFNHSKGPAPQPPVKRRPNPPTELTIPCEFCNTPIPHDELIQHETGCRPDLARFNPRRRSPSPSDDDFLRDEQPPQSPEVELPCEFCSDLFPASELYRHQLSCN